VGKNGGQNTDRQNQDDDDDQDYFLAFAESGFGICHDVTSKSLFFGAFLLLVYLPFSLLSRQFWIKIKSGIFYPALWKKRRRVEEC
jgi:hypothetical protein